MCHDGGASRIGDPSDCIVERGPAMGHESWLALDQIACEDRGHIGTLASLDDVAGKVAARNQLGIADIFERALIGIRNTYGLELCGDVTGPAIAACAGRGQAPVEHRMLGIHTKTDDVDGFAAPGDRDLDPSHERQSECVRAGARIGQPAQFIVIGQGKHGDAIAMRPLHQFGGGQGAIGDGRVTMQIDIQSADARGILAGMHHLSAP